MSLLGSVREACKVDPTCRDDEQINDILEFVKNAKFFAKLDVVQQRRLCKTMTVIEFKSREVIFHAGDFGDKYYLVLSGRVCVQLPKASEPCPTGIHTDLTECDCPGRGSDLMVYLERGDGFGEIALHSDQKRTATVVATEKTELLVTTRADYEPHGGQQHREFIEERVRFLMQCPRIEDALKSSVISALDIAAMANCLTEQRCSGHQVVCRQGDIVDDIIFVRRGSLAVLRDVEIKTSPTPGRRGARANVYKTRPSLPNESPPPPERNEGEVVSRVARLLMDSKKRPEASGATGRPGSCPAPDMRKVERGVGCFGVTSSSRGASPSRTAALPSTSNQVCEASQQLRARSRDSRWEQVGRAFKLATDVGVLVEAMGERRETPTWDHGAAEFNLKMAKQNVDHLKEVSRARVVCNKIHHKERAESRRQTKEQVKNKKKDSESPREPRDWRLGASGSVEGKPRTRLLRIGTVGPFQCIGDQQVSVTEPSRVSLVSDPMADLYVMTSKRLPRKLYAALLTPQESAPNDVQLVELERQADRWCSFRRGVHRDAVSCRERLSSFSRQRTIRRPRSTLTVKDLEHFSQSSAIFLHDLEGMRRDKHLKNVLAAMGEKLHDIGSRPNEADPQSFRNAQFWAKVALPTGLNFEDEPVISTRGVVGSMSANGSPSLSPCPSATSLQHGKDTIRELGVGDSTRVVRHAWETSTTARKAASVPAQRRPLKLLGTVVVHTGRKAVSRTLDDLPPTCRPEATGGSERHRKRKEVYFAD